jgi:glyoxylase-like metal-dependent hydrolase (beta-lactamase superfamily II)
MQRVAPDIYVFGSFSAHSLIVITSAGVIVTDPVNKKNATDMKEAIRKITLLPVKYVIYSHQHWDHILGAKIFKDEGAEIISHQNCIKHFMRRPHPDLVLPDRTISKTASIDLGDHTLELKYYGVNHGDCMIIMHVKGSDIIYVNDLVTPWSMGLGFMPDYDPIEWIRTLKELKEQKNWGRFIGGHGIPIAPKKALVQRLEFMEHLNEAVIEAIGNGYRFEEVYSNIKLPKRFRDMRGYNTQLQRAAERFYHYHTMGW